MHYLHWCHCRHYYAIISHEAWLLITPWHWYFKILTFSLPLRRWAILFYHASLLLPLYAIAIRLRAAFPRCRYAILKYDAHWHYFITFHYYFDYHFHLREFITFLLFTCRKYALPYHFTDTIIISFSCAIRRVIIFFAENTCSHHYAGSGVKYSPHYAFDYFAITWWLRHATIFIIGGFDEVQVRTFRHYCCHTMPPCIIECEADVDIVYYFRRSWLFHWYWLFLLIIIHVIITVSHYYVCHIIEYESCAAITPHLLRESMCRADGITTCRLHIIWNTKACADYYATPCYIIISHFAVKPVIFVPLLSMKM